MPSSSPHPTRKNEICTADKQHTIKKAGLSKRKAVISSIRNIIIRRQYCLFYTCQTSPRIPLKRCYPRLRKEILKYNQKVIQQVKCRMTPSGCRSIFILEIKAQEWLTEAISYQLVSTKYTFFDDFDENQLAEGDVCTWELPASLQISEFTKKPKAPISILIYNEKRLTICIKFTCLLFTLLLLSEWHKQVRTCLKGN